MIFQNVSTKAQPSPLDQDCNFVHWKCFDTLPKAKKCFATFVQVYLDMFIKFYCLNPVLAAFIIPKNTSSELKLLQKYGSGRPRLVSVACSLKCFGNDLISW